MPTIAQFDADRYAATDETRCIKLYVPDDDSYLALVAGLLSLAGDKSNYIDPDSAQAEGVSAVFRDAYISTDWEGCGTPPECQHVDSEITIFPGNMTVVAGNPIVNAVNTSARGNYTSQQSPNINGNSRRTFRYMAAGEWELNMTAVTQPNGCSLQMSIVASDGTILIPSAFNLRTAGTVFNAVFNRTFTLPSSGLTEIFLGVGAGSTGGFGDILQLMEFWRTGD